MWTYFFELNGPDAHHDLKVIEKTLLSQGAVSQGILQSASQPNLYLLQCTVAHVLPGTPKGPKVWVFKAAKELGVE
tara:strand:- start:244 stop:471 length:228 start_codon:yes stop_codon:yes gene_type:complete